MQDVIERPATTDSMEWPTRSAQRNDADGVAAKALMGAAAGAIGVWALDRADWFMWNHESEEARQRTRSVRPRGEPPANVAATKLEEMFGLHLTRDQHETAGFATHYAIGVGPAAVYALVRDKLPGKGPARGLLYGLGMFLLQDEALNTATGLGAKPQAYPWQAHARGLVAHLVYGVVTEVALNAMEKSLGRTGDTARSASAAPRQENAAGRPW